MARSLIAACGLGLLALLPGAASAAGAAKEIPHEKWSFEQVPFGTFDRGALQRGLKVYLEVCASCHSMNLLSYRNLGEKGGPLQAVQGRDRETGEESVRLGAPGEGFKLINANDNPYVKQLASQYEVSEIDQETGDTVTRPARPADRFVAPYPNDAAARAANGGALPPDFSVLAKARHGGASYIKALLSGYVAPPAGLEVPPGQHYNVYMAGDLSSYWNGDPRKPPYGGFLAMAPQLTEGRVTFDDGTPATVKQMASDVATFIAWAADPNAETRLSLGFSVLAYLSIVTGLVYAAYRQVWKAVGH